jgi:hypothetical protein
MGGVIVKNSSIVAFVASVGFSAAVSYAVESQAYTEFYSYASCIANRVNSSTDENKVWWMSGGNVNTAASLRLTCPVTDTTSLRKSAFGQVNVYFTDNTDVDDADTMLCSKPRLAGGGECDSTKSTTGDGDQFVIQTVASDLWDNNNDFAYISVTLPKRDTSGGVTGNTTLKAYELID